MSFFGQWRFLYDRGTEPGRTIIESMKEVEQRNRNCNTPRLCLGGIHR